MMLRSLLYACVAFVLALTALMQPVNADSYHMASNTTYETRAELTRAANDDYSDKSISHERQTKNSLAAASATLMDKEYDQAYKDFSNAFRLNDHEKEESAPKTIINTINHVGLAVMEFIVSL